MSAKSKCGSYTVVGPIKGQPGRLGHSRLFCKSLRCPYCRKPKLKYLRSRIAQLADHAPYWAGEKIEHTLSLLPRRDRIFTTSRGIRLTEKPKSEGWWIVRRSISLIEFASKNPTAHRYKDEKVRPPLLVYFESALD